MSRTPRSGSMPSRPPEAPDPSTGRRRWPRRGSTNLGEGDIVEFEYLGRGALRIAKRQGY